MLWLEDKKRVGETLAICNDPIDKLSRCLLVLWTQLTMKLEGGNCSYVVCEKHFSGCCFVDPVNLSSAIKVDCR